MVVLRHLAKVEFYSLLALVHLAGACHHQLQVSRTPKERRPLPSLPAAPFTTGTLLPFHLLSGCNRGSRRERGRAHDWISLMGLTRSPFTRHILGKCLMGRVGGDPQSSSQTSCSLPHNSICSHTSLCVHSAPGTALTSGDPSVTGPWHTEPMLWWEAQTWS